MALLITALVLRARTRILAGRLPEAEADAREAVQLSALLGTPLARRLAMASHLWALTELGRLDEADRLLEETGLDGAVSVGPIQDVIFLAQRARLRLGQHRVAEALADMEAADRWISGRGISRSIPYSGVLAAPRVPPRRRADRGGDRRRTRGAGKPAEARAGLPRARVAIVGGRDRRRRGNRSAARSVRWP